MLTDWKKLKIVNSRNQQLDALLKPSVQPGRQNSTGIKNKVIVIVCHGFTGSKEGGGNAILMGDNLAKIGFGTLLFDFAGCGKSDGNWKELSLSSQIEDLGAVVKWCRKAGYEKIILNGRSFGGSTVIGYAARDKSITALCTWAAVARPEQLFTKAAMGSLEGPESEPVIIHGEDESLTINRGFFSDLARHDLLRDASAISPRHFLIIHGSEDESVPCEDARLLYQSASDPRELVFIKGANHRFSKHTNEVWEVFFKWLNIIPT
jgi:putative redox protein